MDAASLAVFYANYFPFTDLTRWLAYQNTSKNYFKNREFSFTLANDAYLRFNSYSECSKLKQDVLLKLPVKIDIGPVYNTEPCKKKLLRPGVFKPLERELVFDIDMTDYDEVRTCCQGADICSKCWKYMTIAIRIIDHVLRTDFGFSRMMWVYSGRRGVHCWVCDDRARKLTAEGRKAVVGYIEVIKGGEGQNRKVNIPNKALHPSLSSAFSVLEEYFEKDIIVDQDLLGTRENWQKVLKLIPDEELCNKCDQHWTQKGNQLNSREKWLQLISEVDSAKKKKPVLTFVVRDIIFQFSYPRLDSHVSIGLNHLLKSPFCVHPKTGRVCVPIDVVNLSKFDPFNVPTIQQLDEEHQQGDLTCKEGLLGPYLKYFDEFLVGMEGEAREIARMKQALIDRKLIF